MRYASASGMMERPRSWKSKVPNRNFCLFSAKGVNISYTLFIGIRQVGPHDEAIHVSFGDDGEATGAGGQTRRIGGFKYLRILTVCSYSLVQVRISQSQRHVPRHEPRLALGISRTRRLTPGRVWCRQYRPPEGGAQGRRQQEVREDEGRADAYGSGVVLWQRKAGVVRGKS